MNFPVDCNVLAVVQSATPGQAVLGGAIRELTKITDSHPGSIENNTVDLDFGLYSYKSGTRKIG